MGLFIGGFTAGLNAKGYLLNDGKAGLLAGILAQLSSPCRLCQEDIASDSRGHSRGWYLGFTLYMAIITFIGGAIAGAVRK